MLNESLLSLAWDTGQVGGRKREVKERKKEGKEREGPRLTFSSAAQESCIDFTILLRARVSQATSVLPMNAEKRSS